MSSGLIDPITFQVISTSLTGIVREMQLLLFRTGYSTAIRESQDASCAILDGQGNLVAQFRSLYMHMAIFPEVMAALFRAYPAEQIEDGDAFILNHPYHGGSTHVSDMAVVTPIFYRGRLAAFCTSMAHKTDIGGVVPGSASGAATEIFQEGLLLPPVKYVSRGKWSQEIEHILRANSRTPEVLIGDIQGQIGVCRIGETRIQQLMDKYGQDTVARCFQELMDRTERRVKDGIRQWPDGTAEMEAFLDPDGVVVDKPVRLHVAVAKQADSILFDFSGCDPQVSGPINVKSPGTVCACYFAVIAMIDPAIPNNAGLARAVRTRFGPHSVLNPDSPAPVSCYSMTLGKVLYTVIAVLRRVAGQKPVAQSGTGGAFTMGGRSLLTGKPYIQYELLSVGGGAADGDDGVPGGRGSCRGAPGSRDVPLEIIESEFACRVLRHEIIPDSGGPGRFRGGPGVRREYLILDREARMGLRSQGFVFPASGDAGGWPGAPNAAILNPGTEGETRFPCRIADVRLRPGDVLSIETGGGGGVGNPREREREKVVEDIENGYITRAKAIEIYGLEDARAL